MYWCPENSNESCSNKAFFKETHPKTFPQYNNIYAKQRV